MPNGADIIARRLVAQGCRIAFGMPGGEVLAIFEALEKAGIRFRRVKRDNAGGFMAEGHAHRQALEGGPLVPAGLESRARFGGTDFAAVAMAFGGHGVTVTSRAALEAEARAAFARHDRFTLIAVRIAPDAYEGRL
jgi:thiamine pyrophosphate-dependent acetolactate synthase large subunit-like protein